MKRNFKIIVEYDGTHFAGWQIQKGCTTVQGELQRAVSLVLDQPVKIIGSGRTDAGAHAIGQVANFNAKTEMSPEKLIKSLNSILKTPVVIKSCDIVAPDFHARYTAISKEYHYHILNSDSGCAVGRDYVWHIKQRLDMDKMNECCAMLVGEHDFRSFEASGSPRASTVRKIYRADMECVQNSITGNIFPEDRFPRNNIVFKISGNGFLRFMVRNIVGTIVIVGLSKITPEEFKNIMDAKDRSLAGATAPARGLFLVNVRYD